DATENNKIKRTNDTTGRDRLNGDSCFSTALVTIWWTTHTLRTTRQRTRAHLRRRYGQVRRRRRRHGRLTRGWRHSRWNWIFWCSPLTSDEVAGIRTRAWGTGARSQIKRNLPAIR